MVFLAVLAVRQYPGRVPEKALNLPQTESILGAETQNDDFYAYQTQPGDSLFSLSEKFQVNWGELAALNSLKEPFALEPGQSLKIPYSAATRQQKFYDNLKKKVYMVEDGDSFVGIAQKLNISVTDLLRANPDLQSPDFIRVGQVLRLP